MQVAEPVCCGYSAAFHCDATLASMLCPTLRGDHVVEVGEPRQKRLLAPVGMTEAFHGEQFPLNGVVSLLSQGAGRWHLRVFKDGIPARLLILEPALHAFPVGGSRREGDVVNKMPQSLAQGAYSARKWFLATFGDGLRRNV